MNEITKTTQSNFESIKHFDDKNQEFWYAREFMPMLEYNDWRNFSNVIEKAKTTLCNSYQQIVQNCSRTT